MSIKERSLLLVIFCFIGLGGCFFAYKNGPLPLAFQQSQAVPPGWTPPQAVPPGAVTPGVFPPSTTPPSTPPSTPPPSRVAPG